MLSFLLVPIALCGISPPSPATPWSLACATCAVAHPELQRLSVCSLLVPSSGLTPLGGTNSQVPKHISLINPIGIGQVEDVNLAGICECFDVRMVRAPAVCGNTVSAAASRCQEHHSRPKISATAVIADSSEPYLSLRVLTPFRNSMLRSR